MVALALIVISIGTTTVLYLLPTQAEERVASSVYYQKEWEQSSRSLGLYLKERTGPKDVIFNYGREAQVYFYADREPAIPYFYDWVLQFQAVPMQDILATLAETRPAYIVDSQQAPVFEDWAASHPAEWRLFLDEHYTYAGRIEFADVYVLKGYTPPPDAGAPN
jgi:hypothetical protein